MSSFYLSPNVEKVGRGLEVLVKQKKQGIGYISSQFSGDRSASQELREYKVRIEHKSGAGGRGRRQEEEERVEPGLDLHLTGSPPDLKKATSLSKWVGEPDWIFTCSCSPELRHWSFNGVGQPVVYPICKHIFACLIVHFY